MMMIDTTDTEQRVVRKNELPAPLIPLERLAWNYWWSWAADGDQRQTEIARGLEMIAGENSETT